MTLETFFEKFDRFADAPDAVEKMREFVLGLAVLGKLVPQDPEDEQVGVFLRNTIERREMAIREGVMRAKKALPSVNRDELESTFPKSWAIERLGNLVIKIGSGSTPRGGRSAYVSQGYPFLRSQNIWNDGIRLSDAAFISEETHQKMANTIVCPHDVLLNITGASLGRSAIAPSDFPEANVSQHVTIIRAADPNFRWFLQTFLMSPIGQGLIWSRQVGMAREGLSKKVLELFEIPVPPLAEQKRIVAKVDELMALCDQLEQQQKERDTRRDALVRASLARFAEAPTAANLNFLFHKSYDIDPADLRKSILTLAVQGKLVPQDPKEEPASSSMSSLQSVRLEKLSDGYPNPTESKVQVKKQRKQTLPTGLDILPLGWEWVTLMQASILVVDCHNKTAPYTTDGIPLIRTTNIRNGELNYRELKFVSEETYVRWSARVYPEPGDVLITREAPMGEACIIPDGLRICMGQRIMLIRLHPDFVDRHYILYTIQAPDLMDRVQDKPVGATVQHLRVGGVETMLIPLPPLAEQRRIVAKVDQLMARVDELEAQLAASRVAAKDLLDALVAELTSADAPVSEAAALP